MAIKTLKHVDPFDSPAEREGAGVFGMWIFLLVVGMLFVACILGYLVVRLDRPPGQEWTTPQTPPLPHALLLSTGLLLASSWTMQVALRAARTGQPLLVRHAMGATLALALLFLGVQVLAWSELWRANASIGSSLYAWTFYVLSGTHALHVLGGLVPLAVVFRRSLQDRYTPASHAGLLYCAMYWHALDAIWIALYATLWLGS